jgi:hypothetical protein
MWMNMKSRFIPCWRGPNARRLFLFGKSGFIIQREFLRHDDCGFPKSEELVSILGCKWLQKIFAMPHAVRIIICFADSEVEYDIVPGFDQRFSQISSRFAKLPVPIIASSMTSIAQSTSYRRANVARNCPTQHGLGRPYNCVGTIFATDRTDEYLSHVVS